jgi:hypothetical protein
MLRLLAGKKKPRCRHSTSLDRHGGFSCRSERRHFSGTRARSVRWSFPSKFAWETEGKISYRARNDCWRLVPLRTTSQTVSVRDSMMRKLLGKNQAVVEGVEFGVENVSVRSILLRNQHDSSTE